MRHEVETRLEPEANIAKSNNSKDQESKSQIISEGLHVATIQSSTINARSPRSVTFRPLILMVKSEFRSGKPAQAGRIFEFRHDIVFKLGNFRRSSDRFHKSSVAFC